MILNDEQEECFETELGVPTLTVENPGHQRMIGYSSFLDALMEGNRITVRFRDWLVVITGESLETLWKQFQMQDVRVIRPSKVNPQHGCRIIDIQVSEVSEN